MNKYEERVKQRAYEFARDKYKQSFYQVQAGPPMPYSKFNESDPFVQKAIASISESYMLASRLSVQREAEAFAEGFNSVYDFTNDPEFGPMITEGQIERGLIPPQTQTT